MEKGAWSQGVFYDGKPMIAYPWLHGNINQFSCQQNYLALWYSG